MRRWFVLLIAVMTAVTGLVAAPASAATAPIGRLGETLQIKFKGLVADVTVVNLGPSDIPPGFGYPPRAPRYEVWRAQVVVHPIQVPTPYAQLITYQFRGVTATGDSYEPRNTDAPDALQAALTNAPAGSTVSGGVWWDKITGQHLAQWNVS
jgi:hypothetical protein